MSEKLDVDKMIADAKKRRAEKQNREYREMCRKVDNELRSKLLEAIRECGLEGSGGARIAQGMLEDSIEGEK